jgi:hypothetical protein
VDKTFIQHSFRQLTGLKSKIACKRPRRHLHPGTG